MHRQPAGLSLCLFVIDCCFHQTATAVVVEFDTVHAVSLLQHVFQKWR